MKNEEIIGIIESALSRKKIIWNKHVLERMIQRENPSSKSNRRVKSMLNY